MFGAVKVSWEPAEQVVYGNWAKEEANLISCFLIASEWHPCLLSLSHGDKTIENQLQNIHFIDICPSFNNGGTYSSTEYRVEFDKMNQLIIRQLYLLYMI